MSSPRRRLERLKRIAAAQDRLARIGQRCAARRCAADQSRARRELRLVRELAAKAVAAMQRAGAARDQQRAARVLLDDARAPRALLADGIGREARDARQLCGVRPALGAAAGRRGSPLRMRATNPRGTSSGNRDVGRCAERRRRQLEQAQQLGRIAHGVCSCRLPRRQRDDCDVGPVGADPGRMPCGRAASLVPSGVDGAAPRLFVFRGA